MTPQELLLEVFCLVDDELQALNRGRLRQRGPAPKLADSEVITIELVGEFWKLGTDRDLFRHFTTTKRDTGHEPARYQKPSNSRCGWRVLSHSRTASASNSSLARWSTELVERPKV